MVTAHESTISAERRATNYSGEQPVLLVNGEPLDELLDRLAPNRDLVGLVSTLLAGMDPAEAAIAHRRFNLAPGESAIAPVLMCPDDADFSCTLVVVDAIGTDEHVIWRRIGLDISEWNPRAELRLGQTVEWFTDCGPFAFRRDELLAAISVFQR
jgi:hypothetical protein